MCVFVHRAKRRVLRLNREELRGGRRNLLKKEIHDLYFSPNNIRVIKSWKKIRAGHVAYHGQKKSMYRILVGKA
jgi:hypothetical protein